MTFLYPPPDDASGYTSVNQCVNSPRPFPGFPGGYLYFHIVNFYVKKQCTDQGLAELLIAGWLCWSVVGCAGHTERGVAQIYSRQIFNDDST